MFSSVRRIGPAARLGLARRPWIRWLAVLACAASAGWLVLGQLEQLDAARRSWTDQQTVVVAVHDHAPGDPLVLEERRLPIAAVPNAALSAPPDASTARQRISAGEVVTVADVTRDAGPAAIAEDGDVVVAIGDPLLSGAVTSLSVGLDVAIHSEGAVLAERAQIVAIDGDVVFVALEASDAPQVSAAAQLRQASIAFLG